jgi:hypothetical protein
MSSHVILDLSKGFCQAAVLEAEPLGSETDGEVSRVAFL